MVVTAPERRWPPNGPRPINLKQDVGEVVKLLEMAFGEEMDSAGRRTLRRAGAYGQPSFLWRLNSQFNRLPPGYVWQEDGRIVGNVTLIATKTPGRHIIANVAVHPDYRRRGIARTLMESVLQQVQARHGEAALLQVVKQNKAAIALYKSLGFITVGHMVTWRSSTSRLRPIEPLTPGQPNPNIRPLRANQWQEAYRLDTAALHPDLNWPDPIPQDTYKRGWWRRLKNFFNGRHVEMWAIKQQDGQLAGMAAIEADWGRPYELSLRVHPRWREQLERPLLAKLLRRLNSLSRRNVRIYHPDDDETTSALLQQANFSVRRTLTHMRYDVY